MFTVYGVNHRDGEYQGNKYDNYILFGCDDKGEWDMVKVKSQVFKSLGFKNHKDLVNVSLDILYNKYGQVEDLRISRK